MATTNENFVKLVNPGSVGDVYQAAATPAHYLPTSATSLVNSAAATALDNATWMNFANDGLAKHGVSLTTLTGTTPATLTLVDMTSASTTSTGDTVFATFSTLILSNLGAGSLTVAPGASNPASIGLGGTTPTLTIAAGKSVAIQYAATVVDSTHKTILVTPAADTVFALCVAGS